MQVYSGSDTIKEDIQIQTSTAKLGFKITAAAGLITRNLLATAMISWSKAGKGGNKTITQYTPLINLAEICASGQGLYVLNAAGTEFQCVIDIGKAGALGISTDDYLTLNFKGFVGTWTTKIFSIDSPELTSKAYQYKALAVNNQPVLNLDLRNVVALALPKVSLDNVSILYNYHDGTSKNCKFKMEELTFLMMDTNEIVSVDSMTAAANISVIAEDYVVINVTNTDSAVVEWLANQTTTAYLVTEVVF